MNYPKNLKEEPIKKRIAMLVCAAAACGMAAGGAAGYAFKAGMADGQASAEPIVYGAYDGCCFTGELPMEWSAGSLEFTPLDCRMPKEQQEFVFYLCSGYHMDFALVMALIQRESGFEPDAVSSSGDYGYMQINIKNHGWLSEVLGITDYLDPYQNIRAGVFTLRKLFERYQDASMALMAYNMGEAGAKKLWDKGVFTTDYTQGVLAAQRQFSEQLEGG